LKGNAEEEEDAKGAEKNSVVWDEIDPTITTVVTLVVG
jgi:hypothetical protein